MPQGDNKLMTQAEYARHRGCSREAVRKAVAGERIKTFGPDKQVYADLADLQWQRNTRARAGHGAAGAGGAAGSLADDEGDGGSYNDWRIRREAAEAELSELRLGETRGELIRLSAVKNALGVIFATARDSLLALGSRLAPVLAGETDVAKIEILLHAEIHSALTALAGAGDRLGKPTDTDTDIHTTAAKDRP